MNLFNWNKAQIEEALGRANKTLFYKKYQRAPLDNAELVMFYVEQGGAKKFRKKHEKKERGKKQALTKHHRLPTSIGGTNTDENLSFVPESKHRSWHTLFSNLTAGDICLVINEDWIDPAYRFVCIPTDKEKEVLRFLKSLN